MKPNSHLRHKNKKLEDKVKHDKRNTSKPKKSKLQLNKRETLVKKFTNDTIEEELIDKKPAWVDEDDDNFTANIIPHVKSDEPYSQKLKQKFETLVGKPSWSKIKKVDPEEEDDQILRTVGHLQKKHKFDSTILQPGYMNYQLVIPINYLTRNEGPIISCLEFHPKSSVGLVAGEAGIITLFAVNGEKNNKLHSFKLAKWNKRISSVHFTPDGNEAYISSYKHNYFYVYDLIKAETKAFDLPKNLKRPWLFRMSPNASYIAAADRFDEVYLICSKSKELLRVLKHNSNVTAIVFSHDSSQLYSYLDIGSVTIWDLSTYRSIITFTDHGCVTASCIETSPCGNLLATGSGEGIVNIYKTSSLTVKEPVPLKIINNLTTKITTLKFNPTSEILGMASSVIPNAVKLIHIPSYNVFMNFPNLKYKVNHVHSLNFSPHSGYMGIGNDRSFANLYRLKFYKNY